MARLSGSLYLNMNDIEVESSEDLAPELPRKILNMEAVEVASSESARSHETNAEQLAMAAIEAATSESVHLPNTNTEKLPARPAAQEPSKTVRFRTPNRTTGEVEVESTGVSDSRQTTTKPKSQIKNAIVPPRHKDMSETVDFEEDFTDESSLRLTKDIEDEKIELSKRSFTKCLFKKLNNLNSKMDQQFVALQHRLDALVSSQISQEELMRPLQLSSIEQYDSFRKQLAFPFFRKQLINALVFNGGLSPEDMGIRCLNFLLHTEFQTEFNWFGRSQKLPFSECLADILKEAIWKRFPNANFASVEQRVQRKLTLMTNCDNGQPSRKRKLSDDHNA